MGATTPYTRDTVAERILEGDILIVYRGNLLKIPHSWLEAHPGGNTAILHCIGRDVTDEIEAIHQVETLSQISRYSIGPVHQTDGVWEGFVSPISSGWIRRRGPSGKLEWYNEAKAARSTQNSEILLYEKDLLDPPSGPSPESILPAPSPLSLKTQAGQAAAYRKLHQRVIDAGLYNTPYITGYGPEFIRYALLAATSLYLYRHQWFMTSALFLGLFWHQLVFIAHDLGHMGVTHNWLFDRLISITIADFIGGLSIGWWVENHNVHHVIPNHPNHDPDIQHLPFFAISPVFFTSLWSTYYKRVMHFDGFAKVFIAIQHKLFYVVLALARFNLYANSYIFLFKKAFDTKRARGGFWAWRLEVIGIATFWFWFIRVLRGCPDWKTALGYLIVSHVAASPVHVQIVLSHFSMSLADYGPSESFVHRQMRTTTDVICPESIGFIHGGLHLQVTHHLFPRLPRHNLKKASVFVKEFAEENGLTYAEFGFMEGNQEVIGLLRNVAEQVKIIGKVASAESKEAVEKKIAEADERWKQKVY